mgnify:CR=1 FL=1
MATLIDGCARCAPIGLKRMHHLAPHNSGSQRDGLDGALDVIQKLI